MKTFLLSLGLLGLLSGCVALSEKQFTYNFDKPYIPLPGESSYDPAPWPY